MAISEVVDVDALDQENVCRQEIIINRRSIVDQAIFPKFVANRLFLVQAALRTPSRSSTSVLPARNGYKKETAQQVK